MYIVKKKKLNYIFHNPNTPEKTAEFILNVFIEANTVKVEKAISAMNELAENQKVNIAEYPTE